MSGAEEEYFVPLQDQRVFGAGIKRKRVQFVPSSTKNEGINTTRGAPSADGALVNRYLSIVMPKVQTTPEQEEASHTGGLEDTNAESGEEAPVCEVCSLPLPIRERSHESSIAHQACMPHSHPPSHLDRKRKGLKYLSSYGWDPDSRLGLGAEGHGIRVPIKPKEKNDTTGVGIKVSKSVPAPKKMAKFSAKQARLKAVEDEQKTRKLREKFYMNDDVARHLGES